MGVNGAINYTPLPHGEIPNTPQNDFPYAKQRRQYKLRTSIWRARQSVKLRTCI